MGGSGGDGGGGEDVVPNRSNGGGNFSISSKHILQTAGECCCKSDLSLKKTDTTLI